MVSREGVRNLLQSLQGDYLRDVLGFMRTAATEALKVALCQAAMDLVVIGATSLTACRLKCRGEWRDTGRVHTKFGFRQKQPFILKWDKTLK